MLARRTFLGTRACRITVHTPCTSSIHFPQQHQYRGILSTPVVKKVSEMVVQHDDVMARLTSGDTTPSLGKQLAALAPVVRLHHKLKAFDEEQEAIQDLLNEAMASKDKELEEECQEELQKIEEARAKVETKIIHAVLPKDDDENEDAILEVRAGAGGDEAALFAGELLEAYTKTAKAQGWTVEVLNEGKNDLGGIKDAAVSITARKGSGGGGYCNDLDDDEFSDTMAGLGPYGFFKFESGVHRVQRIPINDVRIHTSACSVAVLPSFSEIRSGEELPMSDLRIDTMRASGAGGQHVNTTNSAIRITHIPTGITASIQDERSQHRNKEAAMKLITARVMDKRRVEAMKEVSDARKTMMGGGDRSERIRTYNYPQDRVTDHRCKQSEHGIVRLLSGADDGLVSSFGPAMRSLSREELMKQIENEK